MSALHGFVPFVHIAAAVLSVVELGLTAYVASKADVGHYSRSPDQVNFMIFNSVWSILVLIYVGFTPLYYAHLFHKLVSLALLAITTIFWFAGSIALAVYVGGPWSCGGNSVCGSLEAAIAFGFFLWALFGFLTALDAIEAMRSRRSVTNKHGATYPGV